MYQCFRSCPPITYLVHIHGDEEEKRRWRNAARLAGFRPCECRDENGFPVLAVMVRDPAEVNVLAGLMRREKVCGSLTPLPC